MPDTSAADLFAWAGALVGGVIAGLGLRSGEKDKKTVPAPAPEMAGVSMALIDTGVQREIAADTKRTADACDAAVRMIADWIKEDTQRRAEVEKQVLEDRVESVEDKIDRLIKAIEAQERGALADRSRHDKGVR